MRPLYDMAYWAHPALRHGWLGLGRLSHPLGSSLLRHVLPRWAFILLIKRSEPLHGILLVYKGSRRRVVDSIGRVRIDGPISRNGMRLHWRGIDACTAWLCMHTSARQTCPFHSMSNFSVFGRDRLVGSVPHGLLGRLELVCRHTVGCLWSGLRGSTEGLFSVGDRCCKPPTASATC